MERKRDEKENSIRKPFFLNPRRWNRRRARHGKKDKITVRRNSGVCMYATE